MKCSEKARIDIALAYLGAGREVPCRLVLRELQAEAEQEARSAPQAQPSSRAAALLAEAACLVTARAATHGRSAHSFEAIARLWNAYLQSKPAAGAEGLDGADVCALMALLKLARSNQGRHVADHGIDAAGYAALWGELRERQAAAHGSAPHGTAP